MGALDAPPPDPNDSFAFEYRNSEVYITDIGDETAPKKVGRLRMAINTPDPRACAAQIDSNLGPACDKEVAVPGSVTTAAHGCTAAPHYHSVNDPHDTRFAMVSTREAGLRIFNIRTPDAPVEVAYFASGQYRTADDSLALDSAGAHPHYDAATGAVWLTTRAGGFWVLELEPQVRAALGLPVMPAKYPNGAPALPPGGTSGLFTTTVATQNLNIAQALSYCRI